MVAQPLEHIRVMEFSTGIAGPICGRYLAHHGAEVIKIESVRKPDTIRLFPAAWASAQVDPALLGDTGPMWSDFNAGKLSAAIEITTPEGMAIVKKLLEHADIFLVNFSAPTVERWGLDYESVRGIRPSILYISLPGFGSTPGPYYDYKVWGPNLSALSGLDHLTGWPDRPASGIGSIAYSDYSNGFHAFFAVLCALEHRDATGEGQYIDMSQYEATVACLGPTIMDYMANGRVQTRAGNRADYAAPQGVYPCRGRDRWVAISVLTDKEWQSLCCVTGHPEWQEEERFATFAARQAHHDEIDEALASWTATQTAKAAAWQLQHAGIAAAPVWDMADLAADPQLEARDFWKLADHARFGKDLVTGHPIHLSGTPARWDRAGPARGQDNLYVLRELCGYREDHIETLVRKGVVSPMTISEVQLRRPYWDWIRHLMPWLPWPSEDQRSLES